MKTKIRNFLFKLALKFIAKLLKGKGNKLTKEMLTSNGWVYEVKPNEDTTAYYVETNIKERDKVYVEFKDHYYRIRYGREKTFIALESRSEWLILFLLLRCKDVKFEKPIDILKGEGI